MLQSDQKVWATQGREERRHTTLLDQLSALGLLPRCTALRKPTASRLFEQRRWPLMTNQNSLYPEASASLSLSATKAGRPGAVLRMPSSILFLMTTLSPSSLLQTVPRRT